jgi:DNA-binding beta-propeller fold protein YncE
MNEWLRGLAMGVGAALFLSAPAPTRAADVLVADRLSDSVYRYSSDGTFLNLVLREDDEIPEDDFISQPTGLALSPDATQLFVSSSQTNSVIRYDYDALAGAASNPFVFATAADGLQFPNAISFNPAGDAIYVSNLGGTGVARFNLDGSSAGAPLAPFGAFSQFSGLAWTPDDRLLVGGFQNSPGQNSGAVGKSDAAVATFTTFIGPASSLHGASGLLVHEGHVYVTSMFRGNVQRFDLNTGALDATFSVTGLGFPQGLMSAPGGDGFLVGVLGFVAGSGGIAHYDFNGALVGDGVFAANGGGGFTEATAMITVRDLTAVPGDFNGDQFVDADDLAAWTTNFGDDSGQATLDMGDADADGDVDGSDFLIWQRNVSSNSGSLAQAVPEPQIAILAMIAVLAAAIISRRALALG